ncbi:cytochrome P450, partial [Conidiobolus coronatus NRRL 28638]
LSLKYGPVVHLFNNVVLLNNLEYRKYWQTYKFKKSVFYTSFDVGGMPTLFSAIEKDYHSKVKKLVLPAFSVKTLANIEKAIYDIGSQGLVSHIQSTIKSGQTDEFDLYHLFHCSTFDVISELVFGTNFNTTLDEAKAKYYVYSMGATQKAMFLRTMIPLYKLIPFPMEKLFKNIIIENIKLRENNPSPDILQSLIDSQDPETGEKLTNDQIAVECMTLLFAGMDTTANTLTWTLYEILRNPNVYELVEKEILDEFPNFNEPISVEKAKSNLKYFEATLLESMRIYPVAPGGLPRVVPEGGVTIAGHYLPANTIILQPVYSMHNDPQNWKNPKVFDIQRWLGQDREKNKSMLMTFGAGPRSCIGRELAWNEMYLVLSNLIR